NPANRLGFLFARKKKVPFAPYHKAATSRHVHRTAIPEWGYRESTLILVCSSPKPQPNMDSR
ncbi:hypothetical protein, partial [Vreelandella alkaliphila]|uniref:hypothetical protein n=1 Tax=Vreelandella alkaliphila TaxID=272774 RepID=UPI003FD7FFDF